MKQWLFASLVACFVGAWVPDVHAQGAFANCCLGYQPRVKWNILQHAKRYHTQEVSGSCNLRAVIFYFRQKAPACMNPEDKDVKKALRILKARNNHVHNPQNSTSGSQTEMKKSNHAKSKAKNSSSTSMKSATLGHARKVMLTKKINN